MAKIKPKLIQNVFEARYDRGYRYLDRCGDVMVILEDALPSVSDNNVWMPDEMQPKGARMKCPELDVILVFDTYRICLDQNPADVECPFTKIAKYAYDTVISKFDIRKTTRLGNRKLYIIPTDSIEKAEAFSAQKAPLGNWPVSISDDMKSRICEVTNVLENEDRSRGVRFSIMPTFKVEAPLTIDKRLTIPPHLLETGQREALISQLKRQKQREKEPLAGLLIDIDYWWLNPEETNIEQFLDNSEAKIEELLNSFLGK